MPPAIRLRKRAIPATIPTFALLVNYPRIVYLKTAQAMIGREKTKGQPMNTKISPRAARMRERILAAALAEFAAKGYDGATIRNIAAASGAKHPIIDYHFGNKEGLWDAVIEHCVGELAKRIESISKKADSRSVLKEIVRTFFEYDMENKAFHRFMIQASARMSLKGRKAIKKHVAPIIELQSKCIKDCQNSGQLPKGDPILFSYMLIGVSAVLSSLTSEIEFVAKKKVDSSKTRQEYWKIIEGVFFDN
ncbi:hypothetical protein CW354_18075 [Marinicaulis flavus]|jgi:TetR/AcrR family transcriptional regulator|uniref:HTH tetR-type domain-containing protein n=1 Tax=Hyphococcus luteus TaxID=2058213 RepID=A0A2S7K170_9PROT|nr:hypothetical protein CW354_18075 [Marinicaulis flavus]